MDMAMQDEGGEYNLDTVQFGLSWSLSVMPRPDLATEALPTSTVALTPNSPPPAPHRDTPSRNKLSLLLGHVQRCRSQDRGIIAPHHHSSTSNDSNISASTSTNTNTNTSNPGEVPLSLNAHVSRSLLRFWTNGAPSDIDDTILLGRTVLYLSPRCHYGHDAALRNLAGALHARFWHGGALADIEEAVEIARMVLESCPVGHSERVAALSDLGVALSEKFWSTSAVTAANFGIDTNTVIDTDGGANAVRELDEAIELHQAALQLCEPGHAWRGAVLNHLCASFCIRYRCLRGRRDLRDAIMFGRDALQAHTRDGPGFPSALNNVAQSYLMKFMLQWQTDDLERAIMVQREAVDRALPRHPHIFIFRANLATCLEARYRRLNVMPDLDDAISLLKVVVDQLPSQHPMRMTCLRDLGTIFHLRFKQTRQPDDIGKAISYLHTALDFYLPDRPECPLLLDKLADSVQGRYRMQNAPEDLQAAVKYRRDALDLVPPGHRGRSMYLNKLATVLRGRFKRLKTDEDLDEAISHHYSALELRPQGHPGRIQSFRGLIKSLKLRYSEHQRMSDYEEIYSLKKMLCGEALNNPPPPGVQPGPSRSRSHTMDSVALENVYLHIEPAQSKQFIRDVVITALALLPPRLLETGTGLLYDRGAQLASFEASTAYTELLTILEMCSPSEHIERIRETVDTYFRYATLSHRWADKEVLLREVGSRSIFDMQPVSGGVLKLRKFCQTAADLGYTWAWCDTCCIDKESSAELQEAIGTMFKWYRHSALTIVYLADVADTSQHEQGKTSSASEAGRLTKSCWFKRGWTLQELLAPRVLLFYTYGWKMYRGGTCTNHKEDSVVLGEVARATGISQYNLTAFEPGTDGGACARLQWAANRKTYRAEDTSYALHGIFDLQSAIFYGEGAEKALGRLLHDIISQSGDTSILDWAGDRPSIFNSALPARLLAYQTVPHQISNPSSSSSRSGSLCVPSDSEVQVFVRRSEPATVIHALYDRLLKIPRLHFLGRHLMLPCIVYTISKAVIQPATHNGFSYELHASGLRPVQVMSEDKIRIGGGTQEYVLVRVWNRRLLSEDEDGGTHEEVGSDSGCGGSAGSIRAAAATSAVVARLVMHLMQPFRALLLVRPPHGEYRRIATGRSITAQADSMANVLGCQVQTLEIV